MRTVPATTVPTTAPAFRPAAYRFVYQPRPERLPRWLLKVWGWF